MKLPFKTVVFWEDVRNFSAGRRFSSPNCSLIFLKFRSEIVLKTIIHEKELLAFLAHGKAVGPGIKLLMQEGGSGGGGVKNVSSEQKRVRLVLCVMDCPPVKPNDQPLFGGVDLNHFNGSNLPKYEAPFGFVIHIEEFVSGFQSKPPNSPFSKCGSPPHR